MVNLTVEITHPPYGHENTFAGLYVAVTSLAKGMNVTVVLHGDGVYAGLRGQIDPEKNINMPSTESQLDDILAMGGRIVAYQDALVHRGISNDELVEGIEIKGSSEIFDLLIDDTDKIIPF